MPPSALDGFTQMYYAWRHMCTEHDHMLHRTGLLTEAQVRGSVHVSLSATLFHEACDRGTESVKLPPWQRDNVFGSVGSAGLSVC